jgi:hypothetical protein
MPVDDDPREFGQHFKQGGWRLGQLVARNVEPHKGQGKPRPHVDEVGQEHDSSKPEKVSGAEFASRAGVSKQHIANYFNAWELAADEGLCQHARDLSPGDEDLDDIEEDDEHTREKWSKFLEKAKKPKEPGTDGSKSGSGSKSATDGTPDIKVNQAVESFVETSEQLSKRLRKVVDGVGPKLMGDNAGLAQFVEDLRQARAALDRQCREIDQLLQRIGFGDTEPAADIESI